MSWRVGIATGACLDRPILDVLPAIRSAGAVGVEIGTPPKHFDPWDERQIDELHAALTEHHLEAVSIHTPFGGPLDLADSNSHHRHAAVSAALTSSLALKRLGGRLIIVHPSDLPRNEHHLQARLVDAARSLAILATNCADEGMTLIVESPLPHLIGGHPSEFEFLLSELPEAVGVCLDTGHVTLGHQWDRFVEVAGARLMHIHANDNRGAWDDHLPPGQGRIDWDHVRSSLRAARFEGWIMLELACPGARPLADYLRSAYSRTAELLHTMNHPHDFNELHDPR